MTCQSPGSGAPSVAALIAIHSELPNRGSTGVGGARSQRGGSGCRLGPLMPRYGRTNAAGFFSISSA